MKRNFYKYYVVMFFVLFAIILFFVGRLLIAEIYKVYNEDASPGEQLIGRFIAPFQFLGIYVLLLTSISIIGYYWSRRNTYWELNRGFLYAIFFSLFIVSIYAGLVIYLFT